MAKKKDSKKPTEEQIKDEVKKLLEMKPTVLPNSMFGDDHHAAIDAQIRVLENLDEFFDEEEIERIAGEDEEGWADNVCDQAIEAFRWTEGESEDGAPSKGWENLVRK